MPSPERLLVAEALHICLAKQAARMHVSCAEVRTACTCPKCPRGQLGCFPSEAASALRLREASVAYAMMMMMIKVREWYDAGLPAARYACTNIVTNNIVVNSSVEQTELQCSTSLPVVCDTVTLH